MIPLHAAAPAETLERLMRPRPMEFMVPVGGLPPRHPRDLDMGDAVFYAQPVQLSGMSRCFQ